MPRRPDRSARPMAQAEPALLETIPEEELFTKRPRISRRAVAEGAKAIDAATWDASTYPWPQWDSGRSSYSVCAINDCSLQHMLDEVLEAARNSESESTEFPPAWGCVDTPVPRRRASARNLESESTESPPARGCVDMPVPRRRESAPIIMHPPVDAFRFPDRQFLQAHENLQREIWDWAWTRSPATSDGPTSYFGEKIGADDEASEFYDGEKKFPACMSSLSMTWMAQKRPRIDRFYG